MQHSKPGFREQCYKILARVPEGKVTTYSEIANALNCRAARAVGTAMAKNEKLIEIPCHRVIRSDGSVGEYAAGTDKKIALLKKEGVPVNNGKVQQFHKYLHRFT